MKLLIILLLISSSAFGQNYCDSFGHKLASYGTVTLLGYIGGPENDPNTVTTHCERCNKPIRYRAGSGYQFTPTIMIYDTVKCVVQVLKIINVGQAVSWTDAICGFVVRRLTDRLSQRYERITFLDKYKQPLRDLWKPEGGDYQYMIRDW